MQLQGVHLLQVSARRPATSASSSSKNALQLAAIFGYHIHRAHTRIVQHEPNAIGALCISDEGIANAMLRLFTKRTNCEIV